MFKSRRVSPLLPAIALLLTVSGCQDSTLPSAIVPDGATFARGSGGSSFVIIREAKKYKNVGIGWTWEEAEALARTIRSRGGFGYLATILNEEENNEVGSRLSGEGCWIGLRQTNFDDEPAGGWEWITAAPLEWEAWGSGEPNNWDGNEHFAEITRGDQGDSYPTWNDLENSNRRSCFVVRFDP